MKVLLIVTYVAQLCAFGGNEKFSLYSEEADSMAACRLAAHNLMAENYTVVKAVCIEGNPEEITR